MSLDPLQIEQLFNETKHRLKQAGSERVQLFCMYHFLETVHPDFSDYESYLIQLFEDFPSLKHPLLFTGLRPEKLAGIIDLCEQAVVEIDSLRLQDELLRKTDLLKTGLSHLHNWLGIVEAGNEVGSDLAQSRFKQRAESVYGEVFIPVIEQDVHTSENTGRLRKLSVNVIGESSSGVHELKPVFGVIGANTGNLGEKPARAAGASLDESRQRHKTWSGTARFELSHTWHAGSSANLALAGLFYCEMLKAEQKREYFRLNPGIAITGDIDEAGNVMGVDSNTLPQKVEAAFFSWVQVLVVPVEQLTEALDHVENLKQGYPNRELTVIGIGQLRELFYDRRLSLHKQISLVEHTAKRVWDKKYSAVGIVTLLILLGVIGRMAYGPVDRNPTHATYSGENAYIRNESGTVLREIFVGKEYVITNKTERFEQVSSHLGFYDIGKDGINEVFENKSAIDRTKDEYNFLIYSLNGDTLYNRIFKLDVPFDKHPYVKEGIFNVRKFEYLDLDGDRKEELLILMSIQLYFTSILAVLDVETGKMEDLYVNAGYLRDFKVTDLDKDGIKEVILSTEFKGHNSVGIVILDGRYLSGKGILGERYQKSDMKKAIEKAAIKVPQTIVGKVASRLDDKEIFKYGFSRFISLDEDYFTFLKDDWHQARGVGAKILFQFYNDLNVRAIVSADSYDNVARELYEDSELPFEIDAIFLDTYRDSLEYWDGSEFVTTPTLNKQYLEAVGEDSAYYKDFYFSN